MGYIRTIYYWNTLSVYELPNIVEQKQDMARAFQQYNLYQGRKNPYFLHGSLKYEFRIFWLRFHLKLIIILHFQTDQLILCWAAFFGSVVKIPTRDWFAMIPNEARLYLHLIWNKCNYPNVFGNDTTSWQYQDWRVRLNNNTLHIGGTPMGKGSTSDSNLRPNRISNVSKNVPVESFSDMIRFKIPGTDPIPTGRNFV